MMISISVLALVGLAPLFRRVAPVANRTPSREPISPTFLPLSLLFALACSGDASNGAPFETVAASDTEVVPAEAVQVTKPSDQIASIVDLAFDADGTVWVLNTTEPFFVAISDRGEVLDHRGRLGDGPGEFRSPSNLLHAGRPPQVWALDSRARKLARVDGPDDKIEELFLPQESGTAGAGVLSWEDTPNDEASRGWIAGGEDGFLFTWSEGEGESLLRRMWDFEVVHLSLDTATNTVLTSVDLLGDPTVRYGEWGELHPVPAWTACPDGRMALYDPQTNSIRRLTQGGEELGSHALPPERLLKVTLERAFALLYRPMMLAMERPDGPQTEGFPTDSAALFEMFKAEVGPSISETDLFPEYKHLACAGPSGTLWLQIFNAESTGRSLGDGPEWLRIGPDGVVRQVVFPPNFAPLRFTDDRVWGSHKGELDVESVAWIELQP